MNSRIGSLFLSVAFSAAALQGQTNLATETLVNVSRLGDLKSAETLVAAGVDPNLPNEDGRTALYYAALFNRNDVAALLLAHNADPNVRVNSGAGDKFAQTPLQIAASMGNLRMASMLVAAGAQVDTKASHGSTALHFAVAGSHLDLIRFLIEKDADVNARDADGASPLDNAVWRGNLEATAILLAQGARLNETETQTGASPINEAAYRGETQLVRYLLHFSPNLAIPDKRGYTPLENATRLAHADSALLLLNAAPKDQMTPDLLKSLLNSAVKKDESAVVEALLRRGALTNDPLSSGATPLDAAAAAGAEQVVRVLLRSGADPNKMGRNGTSPLEDASLKGFGSIAGMLLDHGARVNQVNTASGTTALYAAAAFGKSGVATLLLRRGADPNACGRGRTTPYGAALQNGYSDIAAQIQHYGGSRACKPAQIQAR